eukprot:m.869820 g.869820  ORF g.869820 m.869820 type:complete len:907 (+) comp59746_c0_seq3:100-2820(+)
MLPCVRSAPPPVLAAPQSVFRRYPFVTCRGHVQGALVSLIPTHSRGSSSVWNQAHVKMGTLFRSQAMSLGQIFMPADSAYDTVAALGEVGCAQFRDLNQSVNAFQRRYVGEIRRCDNMQRQLSYLSSEMESVGLKPATSDAEDTLAPAAAEFDALQVKLAALEAQMVETATNDIKMKQLRLQYTEIIEILTHSAVYFNDAQGQVNEMRSAAAERELAAADDIPLISMQAEDPNASSVQFVAGVVLRSEFGYMERLLWRACHGNVYLRSSEIHDKIEIPADDPKKAGSKTDKVDKNVFVAFFQGERQGSLIKKIAVGHNATLYPLPAEARERATLLLDVKARLADINTVLARSQEMRKQALSWISDNFSATQNAVKKVKAIYATMNKFSADVTRKAMVAECWYPTNAAQEIRDALTLGTRPGALGAILQPVPVPAGAKIPTFFKTNTFTDAFQSIVDAYGVATYQEANPAPFAMITFPFLFAVMFGDFGHGILMALAAYALIHWEVPLKKFKEGGEIWDTMFGGRYVIFLMGLFSMYTGFIYNDWFSKPVTFGKTGWSFPEYHEAAAEGDTFELTTDNYNFAYPIGVDPVWMMAENKLTFSNSFKMKMAVILGVCQMLFGIIMSLSNHRYFKRPLNIFCEFIPQVIFLTFIFGYLCCMIFYKWATSPLDFPNQSPPSLLLMLINMFLKFGAAPEKSEVLYGDPSGSTQANFQSFLVVIAVICIPWMLLIKPFVLKHRAKKTASHLPVPDNDDGANAHPVASHTDEDDEHSQAPATDDHGHGGEFNFGEIMVHQAIHTIEFCLGCISNTASYLRLWALSLAHAQLSEVLWAMVLHSCFGNGIMLFVGFAVWAFLTIAILLIMEGLSAFLHALRLHWVEFQNKFYDGNGVKFAPFSLHRVISGKAEEDE